MKNHSKKIIISSLIITLLLSSILFNTSAKFVQNKQEEDFFVSLSLAKEVAQQKINYLEKSYITCSETLPQEIRTNNKVIGYIFTLQPKGYMVISANYHLPPVIAYSFEQKIKLPLAKENKFFQMLSYDFNCRYNLINDLPQHVLHQRMDEWNTLLNPNIVDSNVQKYQQWPPENSTPTEGWIETNWHQNAPYNDLCPIDLASGDRCLAGCPAVTIAQILNYHETTNNVFFTDDDDYYHNYGGNQYWIDDDSEIYDFPAFPQLNNYLSILTSKYENNTPIDNTDKASLIFACGIAAEQVYNPSGSGTFGVDQAFNAYTKLNFNNHSLLDESNSDLYPRLIGNIKNATPAHLAIVNPEWTSGHNLVIDGYNTDDYYHLNFGWGGSYNGWYLLPDDLPYGLTVIEGVIIDIYHNETEENQLIQLNVTNNWNFFSIPCNQTLVKNNITISYDQVNYSWTQAVSSGIINDYIFGWDRGGQYYHFSENFFPGHGYWIFSYEDCTLWLEPNQSNNNDHITIIEAGWNMIGPPFEQSINKEDMLVFYNDSVHTWNQAVTEGVMVDFVYRWDRINQYYQFADIIIPDEAYWVYTSQTCTLKRND